MKVLKVITDEWPQNPFFNLAFEEALYSKTEEPVLRIWRNDKVVVIGRHQCALLEVNPIEALRFNVRLVRRFTGGGAVYHDIGNVNYAVVLPRRLLGLNAIEDAFRVVGEAIVKALNSLGLKDVRYRPLNDIEIGYRKVSGMAATISKDKAFVHGALLVKSDLSILWRVLKISKEKLSDKKFVESKARAVTTLEEALGRKIDVEKEVFELISKSIAEALKVRDFEYKRGNDLMDLARELYRDKYSKTSWNLKYLDFMKDHVLEPELNALLSIARPAGEV